MDIVVCVKTIAVCVNSLHPGWAEKHLSMLNLQVDQLQQKKTTLGPTPVSQEQESEAIMGKNYHLVFCQSSAV